MNSQEWVLWYLEQVGRSYLFKEYLSLNNMALGRLLYGQAFYNALPREDQQKLYGTPYDTFHTEDPFACYLAIENVLTK